MKAIIINKHGKIEDIRQIEIEPPPIDNDEVLVKVKFAAINPADLKVISGKNGGKFIHSSKAPIGIGYDFSGVIEKTGAGVTQFKTGEEVFGFLPYSSKTRQGSFAHYVAVKSNSIVMKPAAISHAEAAAVATTACTAWDALVVKGNINPHDKVLINGASGGVGTYAGQLAKHFKAEAWGICSAGNIEYIKSLGYQHPVDYRKTSLRDLTDKFDIILDAVSNSSYGECYPLLAPNGTYITLLPSFSFFIDKIRSLFSSKKCAAVIVQPKSETLSKIADLLQKGEMSSVIAETYPLEQLQQALEKFSKKSVRGKISIRIDHED